jgi:hypothetical protein
MSATITRLFQALNGEELKTILKREVNQLLEDDSNLAAHLTFDHVETEITIRISSKSGLWRDYVLSNHRHLATEAVAEVSDTPVTATFSSKRDFGEVPDLDRQEAGLETTRPTRSPAGVVADLPFEMPKTEPVTVGGGTEERPRNSATVGKGAKPRKVEE